MKFLAFGHIFALFASISSAIAATATRRRLSRIRPPQWSANSSSPSVITFWQAHHPPCEVGQVSCKRRLVPFLTSDLSPLARWSGSQAGQTSLEDVRKTCFAWNDNLLPSTSICFQSVKCRFAPRRACASSPSKSAEKAQMSSEKCRSDWQNCKANFTVQTLLSLFVFLSLPLT